MWQSPSNRKPHSRSGKKVPKTPSKNSSSASQKRSAAPESSSLAVTGSPTPFASSNAFALLSGSEIMEVHSSPPLAFAMLTPPSKRIRLSGMTPISLGKRLGAEATKMMDDGIVTEGIIIWGSPEFVESTRATLREVRAFMDETMKREILCAFRELVSTPVSSEHTRFQESLSDFELFVADSQLIEAFLAPYPAATLLNELNKIKDLNRTVHTVTVGRAKSLALSETSRLGEQSPLEQIVLFCLGKRSIMDIEEADEKEEFRSKCIRRSAAFNAELVAWKKQKQQERDAKWIADHGLVTKEEYDALKTDHTRQAEKIAELEATVRELKQLVKQLIDDRSQTN